MSFRRAAKVDDNQSEIVKAFRGLGFTVLIISQLKNCCDIFVSKYGRTIAIEIKDGSNQQHHTIKVVNQEGLRPHTLGE